MPGTCQCLTLRGFTAARPPLVEGDGYDAALLSAAEENKSCCLTAQPLRPACLLRLTCLCWCWLLPSRFRCLDVRSLAAGPQQYPWVPAGPQHFVTFLFVYYLLVLPHIPSFLVSSARAQGMVGATLRGSLLRVLAVLCQCHWVRVE